MARLPLPPSNLAAIDPSSYPLAAGSRIWRIYKRGGHHPGEWNTFRHKGPVPGSRFDHHDRSTGVGYAQLRGIIYGAMEIITCVAESFQSTAEVDRTRDEPWLVEFSVTVDVALLNLREFWPTKAGASMLINSDQRRDLTQSWSAAIYDVYPDIHGLWYSSSMAANNEAVAFYERAKGAISPVPSFHRPLSDPGLTAILADCCVTLGYDLK